jgi:uncharacterized small protein (DUF1192 family)
VTESIIPQTIRELQKHLAMLNKTIARLEARRRLTLVKPAAPAKEEGTEQK